MTVTVAGRARGNSPLALHPSALLLDIFATIIPRHGHSSLCTELLKPKFLCQTLPLLQPEPLHASFFSRLNCHPKGEGSTSARSADITYPSVARWPRKEKRRPSPHRHRQRILRCGQIAHRLLLDAPYVPAGDGGHMLA